MPEHTHKQTSTLLKGEQAFQLKSNPKSKQATEKRQATTLTSPYNIRHQHRYQNIHLHIQQRHLCNTKGI